MKYIKDHIMFLFPMLAILLGIESFIVFERMSNNYESSLKSNYAMLLIADRKIKLSDLQQLDKRIGNIKEMQRREIVKEVIGGMSGITEDEIIKALPYFYTIHLNRFLNVNAIKSIKNKLVKTDFINKVEAFDKDHKTTYNLFIFIKIALWGFVGFLVLSSLFLVIKQMEVWQLAHKERMQVMEIFGASVTLRSGVLFKRAIIDAAISMIITISLFIFLRFIWVEKSGIDIFKKNMDLFFRYQDIVILWGISMLIVITAVMVVVVSNRESKL